MEDSLGKVSNISRVIGIQFSILSPDEIRNGSVAQITSRDTYINGKPVVGGLFDPRMGVLDPGVICPTDGNDYIKCPGFFGHIELAKPVYYIQYLTTILKILRVVCIKCSKLLIDKSQYSYLESEIPFERWNKVFSIANKVKRCGECTEDGCGCKQPSKIKKDGLATIYAEWDSIEGINDEGTDALSMQITPEVALKILRRISDDDCNFMGFNPVWSRPDWMICQVLAVPPPPVRPSVKHDAQQRSEDDLSHIYVNIIKANSTLQDKINQNAAPNVIDDWATVLQYYIATMVDNKIPGVAAVAQRSGRALKSLKDRLNGKPGRLRWNLMGKRVDYSARSVITPDPNLSINQLGVPLKIAKNITRPSIVNDSNKSFLLKLVRNGPDEYPGAKLLEKKKGETISLRYSDRNSLVLENGDIVHRHLMDGDIVLFNRQPTLHRMSMMAHLVKVMKKANTFRINVGVTKPYNADFDGDEMNLHMPQSILAEAELRCLANVSNQIISPAQNQSIVGIFQDSLLGAHLFSRSSVLLSPRRAMNIMANLKNINLSIFENKDIITSFDVLSQIIPPISLYAKNSSYKSEENKKESNNVIEIKNGNYLKGQLDKGMLGSKSKGIIQRIFNAYGPKQSADFIDNIQFIANRYMAFESYSVGISDLIADNETKEKTIQAIFAKKQEVKNLSDQIHLGLFENSSGNSNQEEFEMQVNNILGSARSEAGKIGKNSLSPLNRFVIMATTGSKGGDINISQMISCLGQQHVEGKRIPYGFKDRTLPHYSKFDDSPRARGFIENSFIEGLAPDQFFFHAMCGRVGLIDTAVKTSQTGYIQRRLIKSLEDLHVKYDCTVRNNKNKIIQFSYGGDNVDPIRVEQQSLPLCTLEMGEIYQLYNCSLDNSPDEPAFIAFSKNTMKRMKSQEDRYRQLALQRIDFLLNIRNFFNENVFKNQNDSTIFAPVCLANIIENIKNQENIDGNTLTDLTPLEFLEIIDSYYSKLEILGYYKPTLLFKTLFYFYISPYSLLIVKRFNRRSIIILMETIILQYKQSVITPGEMVGIIAAQSIGEPTTQLTLNTFHFAGVASKSSVTRGVPRIEEILSLSENPKAPSMTVYLKQFNETDKKFAKSTLNKMEYTNLAQITKMVEICFDPDDYNTNITSDAEILEQYHSFEKTFKDCLTEKPKSESSKWVMRIILDRESMLDKNITMEDVYFAIKSNDEDVSCLYSDYNSDDLIFRIRPESLSNSKKKSKVKPLDQTDEIHYLKAFEKKIMYETELRGIPGVTKIVTRCIKNYVSRSDNGEFKKQDIWVLDTTGTNLLNVLKNDYIDATRTFTNDIQEVYKVLGIEAARNCIYDEITEGFEFFGAYSNSHHTDLLCDRMTCRVKMVSVFRHGINSDNIGPIAKATFEETPEMFLRAARHGETDNMRGVSANVMCGQEGYFGTNCFNVLLDTEKYVQNLIPSELNSELSIEEEFGKISDPNDPCNYEQITIQNNIGNIQPKTTIQDSEYKMEF